MVRVRFAPSPTGFLHIGGVRTALFNWLYARHHGGKFLLRIEDTDVERSEVRFTEDIMESLRWLGLDWDEPPLFQSRRFDVYREKAEELVRKGQAYWCRCTEADVEAMREKATAAGKKPQYDRTCRELGLGPHAAATMAVRAKVPLEGFVEFEDLIRGKIRFQNADIDDFVLVRSNGVPTYNFSVVVDDVETRMTHIIRGDDHINNTPKQLHVYEYFHYPIPKFAHLPMILGPDKKKLSKRHGAVSAIAYREEGYLPEALLNFLVRLGWSFGDQEIFSVEEMVKNFDFDRVQKSSGVFNSEKLLWLNSNYIKNASSSRLLGIITVDYRTLFSPAGFERLKTPLGEELVRLVQPKAKRVKELAEQLVPLCAPEAPSLDREVLTRICNAEARPKVVVALEGVLKIWGQAGQGTSSRATPDAPWGNSPSLSEKGVSSAEIEADLRAASEAHGLKLSALAQPLRLALTGREISAGLFEMIALLPHEVVSSRLQVLRDKLSSL